jgi:hypothetical protein
MQGDYSNKTLTKQSSSQLDNSVQELIHEERKDFLGSSRIIDQKEDSLISSSHIQLASENVRQILPEISGILKRVKKTTETEALLTLSNSLLARSYTNDDFQVDEMLDLTMRIAEALMAIQQDFVIILQTCREILNIIEMSVSVAVLLRNIRIATLFKLLLSNYVKSQNEFGVTQEGLSFQRVMKRVKVKLAIGHMLKGDLEKEIDVLLELNEKTKAEDFEDRMFLPILSLLASAYLTLEEYENAAFFATDLLHSCELIQKHQPEFIQQPETWLAFHLSACICLFLAKKENNKHDQIEDICAGLMRLPDIKVQNDGRSELSFLIRCLMAIAHPDSTASTTSLIAAWVALYDKEGELILDESYQQTCLLLCKGIVKCNERKAALFRNEMIVSWLLEAAIEVHTSIYTILLQPGDWDWQHLIQNMLRIMEKIMLALPDESTSVQMLKDDGNWLKLPPNFIASEIGSILNRHLKHESLTGRESTSAETDKICTFIGGGVVEEKSLTFRCVTGNPYFQGQVTVISGKMIEPIRLLMTVKEFTAATKVLRILFRFKGVSKNSEVSGFFLACKLIYELTEQKWQRCLVTMKELRMTLPSVQSLFLTIAEIVCWFKLKYYTHVEQLVKCAKEISSKHFQEELSLIIKWIDQQTKASLSLFIQKRCSVGKDMTEVIRWIDRCVECSKKFVALPEGMSTCSKCRFAPLCLECARQSFLHSEICHSIKDGAFLYAPIMRTNYEERCYQLTQYLGRFLKS